MASTKVLDDPRTAVAALHPVRAAILDAMREPTTAAAVARAIGQSRQNVAYHVRELAKARLLRRAGRRRNGNFVEQLYVAAADTLVLSPSCAWGERQLRTEALAGQLSLGALYEAGARLQRDTAALLDRAAFDGEEIPSASVSVDARFASEQARAAFLREAVDALTSLAKKHGGRRGERFRLLLAAYPDPEAT